jgi:phage FluMu protein gp41
MTRLQLNHITDLHMLSDEDVKQMARELPGIVATLRLAARGAKDSGVDLRELLPVVVFDSELKDEVVITQDGTERVRVSTQEMTEADFRDATAAFAAKDVIQSVMEKSKPTPRP